MKKIIIPSVISFCLLASQISFAGPATQILLPYAQINIEEDYLASRPALASFANYLPGKSYTLSGDNQLIAYFEIKDAQLFLNRNMTKDAFASFAKSCSVLDNDNNKLLCNVAVTSDQGQSGQLPIILYNGLRAKTIDELISARVKDNQVNHSAPYFLEISATANDFQKNATSIVNLHNYFAGSDGASFTLDA